MRSSTPWRRSASPMSQCPPPPNASGARSRGRRARKDSADRCAQRRLLLALLGGRATARKPAETLAGRGAFAVFTTNLQQIVLLYGGNPHLFRFRISKLTANLQQASSTLPSEVRGTAPTISPDHIFDNNLL